MKHRKKKPKREKYLQRLESITLNLAQVAETLKELVQMLEAIQPELPNPNIQEGKL